MTRGTNDGTKDARRGVIQASQLLQQRTIDALTVDVTSSLDRLTFRVRTRDDQMIRRRDEEIP